MLSTIDVRHHGAKLRYTVLVLAAMILVAGSSARAADPFKIAMLPDTQYYSEIPAYNEIFYNQADYVSDTSKFSFVTHVGDIVQNGYSATQWAVAENAFGRLDQSGIAYGVSCGNHDYDSYAPPSGDATSFTSHFGPQRFANKSWEYGSMSGSGGKSSYHIFDGGGRDFMSLNLSMNSPDADLAWAQSAIDAHPDIPVIVSTHEYLKHDPAGRPTQAYTQTRYGFTNVNSPEQVWQKFIGTNDRIFMVLGGHWHGEYNQTSTNIAGKPVHEIVADYQGAPNGGNGYLRELHFKPDEKKIEVHTYSPWLNVSETDANSRFDLYFDYDEAISPPAAPAITWTADVFDADSDISTNGTLVLAMNEGDGAVAVTVNGVTFAANSGSLWTEGGTDTSRTDKYAGGAIGSLSNADAQELLDYYEYGTGVGNSLARLTGLTVGQEYEFQLLVVNDRDDHAGRTISAGGTTSSGDEFYTLIGVDHTGQPVVLTGVFTADETFMDIHIQESVGANGIGMAWQLRAVPEPATMSLLGIGGLLALVRRKR